MTALAFDVPAFSEPALCAQTDPDAFYPEKGDNGRAALAVCTGCPAREECLQYALDRGLNNWWDGIWGGSTPAQRRRMTSTKAKRPSAATCGTTGGAKAHQRRGETVCHACREAANLYGRERRAIRSARGAA